MSEKEIKRPTHNFYQPKHSFSSLRFRVTLGIVVFVCLVLLANYMVIQTRGREVIAEQANKLNHEVGQIIKFKLRERLASIESLVSSLATLGVVLPKNDEAFKKIIPEIINQAGMESIVAGGGIWPAPEAFKKGVKLHSFFWGRDQTGKLKFYNDYNSPSGKGYQHEEWYVPVKYLKKGRVYWSKSYMDPYSLEPMVTCSMAMWNEDRFEGVATIDLKLTGLSEFMRQQATLIGGYAFAIDRNNRLLSLPDVNETKSNNLKLGQFTQHEFPTLNELTQVHPNFTLLSEHIKRVDLSGLFDGEASQLMKLSNTLAADSYQITEKEAKGIAMLLLGYNEKDDFNASLAEQHFFIENDPMLKGTSSVRILGMPDIGWKVIIAMPTKYTNQVVSKITFRMLSLLFVVLVITAFVYFIFFNSIFLTPVKSLTHQIRKLVSREDYITKLDVQGQNELSELANWFNIRTSQLSDVLDRLHTKNIDLTDARETAEQASRSKNIFLASMSHDIRTPMNGIIGMTDFLANSNLNVEQKNYVRVINSSAQALLSLINDIMDFSKIDENQLDLEEVPFDLRQVIDDCADLVAYQSSEKRLEFVYYLSPEINRHVIGDPNRLRQIIINLTSNAVKFTPTGRVELWVEATYQNNENTQLLLEVRDTGIGLSQSAQQNLFSPFTQGDSSTTRKYGGTGLGLTICKHLSEMMGGSIGFRSEEGVGTTFIFKMKLKTNLNAINAELESGTNNTSKLNASRDLPREKLLILGQNHFQNSVVEQYVEALNYQPQIVTTRQAWLLEQELNSKSMTTTLCTDLGVLGNLESLIDRLPHTENPYVFLVFKSLEDNSEIYNKALPKDISMRFISLPLKYDELAQSLALCERNNILESGNGSAQIQVIGQALGSNIIQSEHERDKPTMLALSEFKQSRILMIEDNKVNQHVLMIMLSNLGLSADVVSDGVYGIEAVNKKNYDLILMDWQMPRMDGLEATRKIRAMKGSSSPKIIAVTANAMSGDLEKCLEAGMDDYLSKPVQCSELETMLRKWLSV